MCIRDRLWTCICKWLFSAAASHASTFCGSCKRCETKTKGPPKWGWKMRKTMAMTKQKGKNAPKKRSQVRIRKSQKDDCCPLQIANFFDIQPFIWCNWNRKNLYSAFCQNAGCCCEKLCSHSKIMARKKHLLCTRPPLEPELSDKIRLIFWHIFACFRCRNAESSQTTVVVPLIR